MLVKCLTGVLAAFAGYAAVAAAPDALPADKKKDPIEFKIVVKKDAYALNLGGRTLQEYREYLKAYEDLKQPDRRFPAPIPVDLTLEWKNVSDEKQTIYVGGDYTLDWELKGPGVVTLKPPVAYTDDIKFPKAITLEPGKTHSISVPHLQGGFRGYGVQLYWTEPGEYTLKASYRTRGEAGDAGSYASEPVKIKVEEPKKNKDPNLPGDPPIRILPVDPPKPAPPIRILPANPALPRPVADPNDKEPVKKEGLELTIVAKKDGTTFKINAKEAKALREELEAILKDAKENKLRERIPAPPAVDFELTIKNVSDKPIDIYVGGDDNLISLELKGPGAVAARYLAITTTEFRLSKKVTLEPGKTYVQPINSLQHGPRGLGNRWYWTEAGEYTLTATWQLGNEGGGMGPKLTSAPLKLTVKDE